MLDLGIVAVEEEDFGLNMRFLLTCGCEVLLHPLDDNIGIGTIPGCPREPHPSIPGPRSRELALDRRYEAFRKEMQR